MNFKELINIDDLDEKSKYRAAVFDSEVYPDLKSAMADRAMHLVNIIFLNRDELSAFIEGVDVACRCTGRKVQICYKGE